MSYLSLIIAAIMSQETGLNGSAWWDLFLNNLVVVETWFYRASWWIWAVLVVLGVIGIIILASLYGRDFLSGCGCFLPAVAIVILVFPFFEWVTMKLAMGMAEAFGPAGVTNQGQLILNAVLYALIGTG